MIKSVNHPWAISDKYRTRYGNTWADIDFVFSDRITSDNFKTDPMATVIGNLEVCGQSLTMTYKDLISYAKSLNTQINNLYAEGVDKTETLSVTIKGREFDIKIIELSKIYSTISEACSSALKGYEIGLYL
tara:strand:- start:1422 stop:1814 length:393 start_codon:yes stop_codon:yes gene_type:complete